MQTQTEAVEHQQTALPRAARQDLAVVDSSTEELRGDDRLLSALISGCHVENAAAAAGISERTAYRRLADPDFRRRLEESRETLRESILSRLADAGNDAVSTLWELLGSEDDSIRLKASKAILDSLMALRQAGPRYESTVRTTIEQTNRTVG